MECSGHRANGGDGLLLHQPSRMDDLLNTTSSSRPTIIHACESACIGSSTNVDMLVTLCEERSTRPTLSGHFQQFKHSKRVFPDVDTVPPRRSNEDTVPVDEEAASPKRSRHEEKLWLGVKREGQYFLHETSIYGSCDLEMRYAKFGSHEYVTPLIKCEGADNYEAASGVTFSCFSCVKGLGRSAMRNMRVPGLRWLFKKQRSGSRKRRGDAGKKTAALQGLEALPLDMHEKVFLRLPLKELFLSKILSKSFKDLAGSVSLLHLRGASGEGYFTAINFFIRDMAWQCTGLDLQTKTWRRLPTLSCLPKPDVSLFKEYLVCGHGGLMCANVSKVPHREELVVFNLLTGETRRLPSLHYPRTPVLLHILVDSATNSYTVIAAGSASSAGEESLSRRVEVFSSVTLQWQVAPDIPGPEYALNEHQAGVHVDGKLYFVAFLDDVIGRKGVVGFDVTKSEWTNVCSIPYSSHSNNLQLVESNGKVYLFSEQEHGGIVEHCIDVVDTRGADVACELKSVIRVKKSGGRGLLVYPQFTCVPYGKGKLCVFNTIKRDGVVYDVENGVQCGELDPPPESQRGDNFFSLNPVSFTLQPNFTSKP